MKKLLYVFIVLALAANLAGCAVALVGAGVAGGIAMSEDTVKYDSDRSYNKCWSAVLSELNKAGKVTIKDKDAGRIDANVSDSKVWVTMKQATPRIVRIELKCRTAMFPNMKLGQELMNKIIGRL